MRGRLVKVPRGETVRPTQDMVRQALFSSLADKIPGCRFLDLFAGSGAVGLDAWSRGAGLVYWVESDAKVFPVLRGNIQTLCGSDTGKAADQEWRVIRSEVFRFLAGGGAGMPYDIIFADPPYDRHNEHHWATRLMEELARGTWVAPEGFFVMEQASEEGEMAHPAWEVVTAKRYGGTSLTIYRRRERGSQNSEVRSQNNAERGNILSPGFFTRYPDS